MYFENEVKRGDIYYIGYEDGTNYGMEIGRPGVIVSSDFSLEVNKSTVMVVYCTTNLDRYGAHFVKTNRTKRPSLIKCNEIYTVHRTRLGDRIGSLSEQEMDAVNKQVLRCLGFESLMENDADDIDETEFSQEDDYEIEETEDYEDERITIQMENTLYKKLYEKTMESLVELKFSKDSSRPKETKTPKAPTPKKTPVKEPVIASSGNKVNINTATKEEIIEAGICVATAVEIVRYRKKCGGYKSVEDLKICPRIGEIFINRHRDKFEV